MLSFIAPQLKDNIVRNYFLMIIKLIQKIGKWQLMRNYLWTVWWYQTIRSKHITKHWFHQCNLYYYIVIYRSSSKTLNDLGLSRSLGLVLHDFFNHNISNKCFAFWYLKLIFIQARSIELCWISTFMVQTNNETLYNNSTHETFFTCYTYKTNR